jgi:PIN domain nuclease of toxin-antitoxin system
VGSTALAVRFLLDSSVFLWLNNGEGRLSPELIELLGDPENERYVSIASCWELAIKYARGKLPLPEPPTAYVPPRLLALQAELLAIDVAHVYLAASLPPVHRDPFDRLLVAQSRIQRIPLVTLDRRLAAYGIDIVIA